MFFINYKMTDIVGHQYSMDSEEMGDMLQAQDEELGKILNYLDKKIRDYVLVLSADHGHTPDPERSGAWPINAQELEDDIHRHFDIKGAPLIQQKSAVGLFIDDKVAAQNEVTDDDIARYLNRYTIEENSPKGEVPESHQDRKDELVFEAAFPATELEEVLDCAAGR
jgi:predicted AlkP superfamily pyrophosphatase or phosphodiesterase